MTHTSADLDLNQEVSKVFLELRDVSVEMEESVHKDLELSTAQHTHNQHVIHVVDMSAKDTPNEYHPQMEQQHPHGQWKMTERDHANNTHKPRKPDSAVFSSEVGH